MNSKKVRIFTAILLALMIVFSTTMAFASAASNVIDALGTDTYVKIASLPVGDGAGAISYSPAIEDCEKRGPESFSIADNGDIFILDTLANEVEEFNSTGKSLNTYKLPAGMGDFFDIEVPQPNTFYVLNFTGDILEYVDGNIVNKFKVKFPEEQYTAVGLFMDNNKNVIFRNLSEGTDYYLDSSKTETTYAGTSIVKDATKSLLVTSNQQQFNISYTYTPATTYPLMTTKNDAIIYKTEALIGKTIYTETKLQKYANGKRISTALAMEINGNYVQAVPHKYICCDGYENAYQMVLKSNSVEIYQLEFYDQDLTRISLNLVNQIQPVDIKPVTEMSQTQAKLQTKASAIIKVMATLASVDRTTAYWNCDDMINYSWSFNSSTKKTANTSTTTCPDWLSSVTGTVTETGLPYCWGGANGDVAACGKSSFVSALTSCTAGNVLCSGSYKSGTAGVDCSGFISVGYRFSVKYGTSTLVNSTGPFKSTGGFGNILPGDIFDDPGSHVVMYRYPNFDSNGNIISYATKEATTSGTDKTKNYTRSLTEIQNNYGAYTLK